jgi:uncharacterized protein
VILIESLQDNTLYKHTVKKFEVIETHISWVILTGRYAYKIKKPVNFGFLDFSSLEKRQFFCSEEVRLNRRLAPQLYLEVVTICGSASQPNLEGKGPAIEYAVKMRQFPQSAQLDRLLSASGLQRRMVEELASKVANFHMSIEFASEESPFGDLQHIQQPILDNFQQIHACNLDASIEPALIKLEQWSLQQLMEMADVVGQRKAEGFIRECHGDMHLRNIAWWQGEIIIFDCIEFNKNFFWIDVISDIAFLIMDLEDRRENALAVCFLNVYLEITGDFAGVTLLRFYKVYRALVRAKVNALRAAQEHADTQQYDETRHDVIQYLQLAESYIRPASPCLLINHGMSGSGKSYISGKILEKFSAIRIRSDIERKRLFQVSRDENAHDAIDTGIYTSDATHQTYQQLVKFAKILLTAGYPVIVDAANLKQQQRQLFVDLAKSLQMPFLIIDYQASEDILHQRIKKRAQQQDDVSNATLAVLEHQLKNCEPFTVAEQSFVIQVVSDEAIEIEPIVVKILAYLKRFRI